jgi:lipoprotein-anchoring transpeptidase ErfK/SrfK
MNLPSTTSLLTALSVAALVMPAQALTPSTTEACFGFSRDSQKAPAAQKPERRSRSTTGFSWFGGKPSASQSPRKKGNVSTYPIVQRFGNTTTVKVNGAQRPAVIRHDLLDQGSANQVVIDLSAQRAYVFVNGQVAIDTPVSTAAAGMVTPTGSYSITEKVRSGKVSTIYHVSMPNWMRLGSTAVGMHTGFLPGYPASHGCVRLPGSVAPYIYDVTSYGTRVEIRNSWNGVCDRL